MEVSTNSNNLLIGMVKQSQDGLIVLPQFQRDFVWSREDVKDLLISIIKGYFIGTFLLMKVDKDDLPFQPRAIAGLKIKDEELRPDSMILDGQQRITSLYYAITAPSINLKNTKHPYRFYLDFKELEKGNVDEAILSERQDYCNEYEKEEYQFEKKIIPFTRILYWNEWCNGYMKWLHNRKEESYLINFATDVKPRWENWIKNITERKIPTIEIPKVNSNDTEKIGEVCAIFEKINSTGVKLSVFDLLTARLHKHGIDLHKLWREAITKHESLKYISEGKFDIYGVYILRVISLIRGSDAKGSTLINLKPENFENDWIQATLYFEKAIKRITNTGADGFGAGASNLTVSPKWIPFTTMITVLAGLLWNIGEKKRDYRALEYVKRWYWSSVFLERYGGTVETNISRDYTDLIKKFDDNYYIPEIFIEAENQILNNNGYQLLSYRNTSSIYKGIMNLIALESAQDFAMADAIEFYDLEDHHIFPQAFLKRKKLTNGKPKYANDKIINSVVNKTRISKATNRKILNLAPSEYLDNDKIIPQNKKAEILAKHFINSECLMKLQNDDYDGFLEEREKAFMKKIREKIT